MLLDSSYEAIANSLAYNQFIVISDALFQTLYISFFDRKNNNLIFSLQIIIMLLLYITKYYILKEGKTTKKKFCTLLTLGFLLGSASLVYAGSKQGTARTSAYTNWGATV